MSDISIHLGHTELIVGQEFGSFTLSVKRLKQPAVKVGLFASPVTASQFVAAFQAGMEDEDRAWDERVPGRPLPSDEEPAPRIELPPLG